MSLQSQYPGPIWQNYTQQTKGPATAWRPQPAQQLSQLMQPRQTPVTQNPASAPNPMQQAQGQPLVNRFQDPNTRAQLAQRLAEMYPAPPPSAMPMQFPQAGAPQSPPSLGGMMQPGGGMQSPMLQQIIQQMMMQKMGQMPSGQPWQTPGFNPAAGMHG